MVTSVDTLDMTAGVAGTSALISPDGKHFANVNTGAKTICSYTSAGQKETRADTSKVPLAESSVRWLPDGRKLAFTGDFLRFFVNPDIWVLDPSTGQLADITLLLSTRGGNR